MEDNQISPNKQDTSIHTLYEGVLQKLGQRGKMWMKRQFVLLSDGSFFSCKVGVKRYDPSNGSSPIKSFNILKCLINNNSNELNQTSSRIATRIYSITVVASDGRCLKLGSLDPAVLEKWLEILHLTKFQLQQKEKHKKMERILKLPIGHTDAQAFHVRFI